MSDTKKLLDMTKDDPLRRDSPSITKEVTAIETFIRNYLTTHPRKLLERGELPWLECFEDMKSFVDRGDAAFDQTHTELRMIDKYGHLRADWRAGLRAPFLYQRAMFMTAEVVRRSLVAAIHTAKGKMLDFTRIYAQAMALPNDWGQRTTALATIACVLNPDNPWLLIKKYDRIHTLDNTTIIIGPIPTSTRHRLFHLPTNVDIVDIAVPDDIDTHDDEAHVIQYMLHVEKAHNVYRFAHQISCPYIRTLVHNAEGVHRLIIPIVRIHIELMYEDDVGVTDDEDYCDCYFSPHGGMSELLNCYDFGSATAHLSYAKGSSYDVTDALRVVDETGFVINFSKNEFIELVDHLGVGVELCHSNQSNRPLQTGVFKDSLLLEGIPFVLATISDGRIPIDDDYSSISMPGTNIVVHPEGDSVFRL